MSHEDKEIEEVEEEKTRYQESICVGCVNEFDDKNECCETCEDLHAWQATVGSEKRSIKDLKL